MRIGLIDVDGHNFPNLPLMKLSAWHKAQGDTVEWYDALGGSDNPYDRVYMSKVFTFTPDYTYPIYAREIIQGGTGYDLTTTLLPEVETAYPDYGLCGIKNTAYGFLTRGCPRDCGFCIVSEKEGCRSRKVADLTGFWSGQTEIRRLDPNLLACPDRVDLLEQLADSGEWVEFNQGLDIRLTNGEITEMLMRCKIKMIHFAWDSEADSGIVCGKLREFKRQTGIGGSKARVYVLVNYDTSFEFDLYRIYEILAMGYEPYVMVYNKVNASRKCKDLQRWINRFYFRAVPRFEDYKPRVG